ncbi:uncharacterized protein Z518_00275 [Rhinocladiella mackenziei CBS 650.93]|uniref:Rhinocladiella mackenziei CBS 650.93 unplaced genomic scaffold supercont1.1, whole genome shotgun sequence n=1 Tax=Rhinocladiella mackenziei CBS 650.93 TaxID=1442369 RepID=A0A0D2J0J9_9EURO|nr:uncharacterized protein Z518_00275 [Rhinocladiella mackenziei CBS 650.93]KIX09196.1 hypothetical protein Z518_00275 [Rhinocladiella mackenziei CBS 650.93]
MSGVAMAGPSRVSLPNTLQKTLETPSGRTFLVQISWPLQWSEHDRIKEGECPVIYIADGNALFLMATEASWRREIGPHYSGGGIVVAVGYVLDGRVFDRKRGYDLTPLAPGVSDEFLDFILGPVNLIVAECFPNKIISRQALYGHSYGGLFALYVLLTRPGGFNLFVASSPSAWFQGDWIIREAEKFAKSPPSSAPDQKQRPSLMFFYGSLEQYPKRWHDESHEHFEKREQSCAERKVSENTTALQKCLQQSGKLEAVTIQEYVGEDHGTVMACSLSRSLTTFFEEWPL